MLAGLLPERTNYIQRLGRTAGNHGVTDTVMAYAHAMSDPMFGWQFVKTFLDAGMNMPAIVTESELLRAYCFHRYNNADRDVRLAFQLRTQNEKTRRIMLHCMLLIEKYSISNMAAELILPEDAIRIYEALFWNVRDRFQDKVYINSLVFPDTTQVLWVEDYHKNEDPLNLAIRAAVQYKSLDTVKAFLGMTNQTNDYEAEAHAKTFEAQVLSTAVHSARLGLLHQKDVPSILGGRSMVQSSKLGGAVSKDDDTQLGLGSFGMKASVMDHFRKISQPEIEYRLRLQQMAADRKLSGTAVSHAE